MPPTPTFDARLTSARLLSKTVRELVFERIDGAPVVFDAGQWVNLTLPFDGAQSRRSYSIASPPADSPRFEVAVTRVEGGIGSTYLHNLAPGAVVQVEGPQGFFTRPKNHQGPVLLVGTGTGVTPLRSMVHTALRANSTDPIWLLFGTRYEDDILYRREFEDLAAAHPRFQLHLTLSRGSDAWSGRKGYVQTHVRELWEGLHALGPGAPHAYVCGLQLMVNAVRELLRKEMGIPRQQVHTERYD